MTQWAEKPDSPGWWGFKGHEFEMYQNWSDIDEWGNRELLEEWEGRGKSIEMVYWVKYITTGENILERRRSGPYRGEKTLVFEPNYAWNRASPLWIWSLATGSR